MFKNHQDIVACIESSDSSEAQLTQRVANPSQATNNACPRNLTYDDLPDILSPRLIRDYLSVSANSVTQALKSQAIPNVRLGQKRIIPKASLLKFLAGDVK